MNLFILTNDPTAAFMDVQIIVSASEISGMKAAFRNVEEEEYTLLWPKEVDITFSVL